MNKYLTKNLKSKIKDKQFFKEFNKYLNKKIIEYLFDFDLIKNSILVHDFNIFKLTKEEDEIFYSINKLNSNINNDYEMINLDENEEEISEKTDENY